MERVFESRASHRLHVFTSRDWFIGLPVSFVTGQSDLLKLCFYYTHLQTVLKTCNNGGVLQTKKRFWKKKKDLFLSNNVHQRRKPQQQQQQPRPSMDNSHVNVKSFTLGSSQRWRHSANLCIFLYKMYF